MYALSNEEKQILGKIRRCSPAQLTTIESFIDFLNQRDRDDRLVSAAARASEASFASVWDNPEDAAYDDL